ncbi:MAG: PIN domain-containing protein [Acidimicrobiaceae bacterium]|nr:PIN domain-containing protein [Acidimicrobiaceae bacterium]
MAVVLDTWPVIRMLEGEQPVAARVADLLERESPWMSWINLGEAYYSMRRQRGAKAADEVLHMLTGSIQAELPTPERVIEAATLKSEYRMSYADAFAAATAIAHDAELWTGDPELLTPDALWRWRDLRRSE